VPLGWRSHNEKIDDVDAAAMDDSRSHRATPEPIKDWSPTTLKEKLIKIGAKVVGHGRHVAFQMAEVAISRHLFADILRQLAELRPPPDPAPA
jgi:DDE family transposase